MSLPKSKPPKAAVPNDGSHGGSTPVCRAFQKLAEIVYIEV
jgi:hypothetical protein